MPVYPPLDDDHTALRLGSRIRHERKKRGWTLAQLASRLSLSVGTLSAVENGKTSLQVNLLLAISNVFDVPIDALVPKSADRHFHIARRDQVRLESALPIRVVNRATESLTSYHNRLWPLAKPFIGKHLEPFEIEVQPASDKELRFISHNQEEFVFVLRGGIQCLIKTPDGLTDVMLGPGDCLYFWSYLPHCIRSTGAKPARTIHVLYSPHELMDAEYGNGTDPTIYLSDPTIYLVEAGKQNLEVQIAGKIVALRRARGMSAKKLATQIGVTVRCLKRVENASKPISLELLLQICRAFQKPKEYFLVQSAIDRPFSYALRARTIRRTPARSNGRLPGARSCVAAATFKPLADGFPKHGMQPALVRLERKPGRTVMSQHRGDEFVYVLSGAVRLLTRRSGHLFDETLLPGDACFIDSSFPHMFSEAGLNPYERAGAEILVVRYHAPRSKASVAAVG